MIHFRYHVTTIVAIFLSLGFGLLVGLSLADSEIVREEQASLIRGIEENLHVLRTNNKTLQYDVESKNKVLRHYESIYEQASHGGFIRKLHEMHVTLFVEASHEIVAHDVQTALQHIGVSSQAVVWNPLPLAKAVFTNNESDKEAIIQGIVDLLHGREVATEIKPLIAGGAIRFQQVAAPVHDIVFITSEISPLVQILVDYMNAHDDTGILTFVADTDVHTQAEQLGWPTIPFIHNAAGRFHLAVLLHARYGRSVDDEWRDQA